MTTAIYLVGASGVGKSTLAQAVAVRLGWRYLALSAGEAYAKHGATFDSAEADPELMRKVQTQICVDAATAIFAATAAPTPFVADRSVDYGVYTNLMCQPTQEGKDAVRVMALRLRDRNARVFLVRPQASVLEAARAADAGRRSKFLSDEWVYRVDGAILFYLRDRDIPFAEIGAGTVEERTQFVVRTARGE